MNKKQTYMAVLAVPCAIVFWIAVQLTFHSTSAVGHEVKVDAVTKQVLAKLP